MATRFVPGMPASEVKCPSCGAAPGNPCKTRRLRRNRETLHHARQPQ